jgi:hypothetical protein
LKSKQFATGIAFLLGEIEVDVNKNKLRVIFTEISFTYLNKKTYEILLKITGGIVCKTASELLSMTGHKRYFIITASSLSDEATKIIAAYGKDIYVSTRKKTIKKQQFSIFF